ncbi:SpoIIE family protein phosphatase [Streptomyces sp. NPDC003996]
MIVDDVQGEALEAVETAALVPGAFREAALDAADLVQVGRRPACSIDQQLDGEKCVTAVLAEVSAHQVTILNFRHPSRPMLLRAVGTVDLPNRTPMPRWKP